MIDYIIKAIEEYVKSHQHLKLYESLLPKFNKFHEYTCITRQMKSEKGLICDNNGNEVYTKTGSKHRITIPDYVIDDLYEKNGELNITHNHPSISQPPAECLSSADVDFLFQERENYSMITGETDYYYPLKSMSCESPNGSRMSLVRGDYFKHENVYAAMGLGDKLQKEYNSYIERYAKDYHNVMDSLDIKDYNDANEMYHDCAKKTLKRIGRFEDSAEFRKLKRDFRKLDCRLSVTYPYDYAYR